jgi:ATP-dependent DNA helicase RecG
MNRGEEILSMLAAGEGQTVEFKSSFNAEVIETLVAFANANGGNVVIGINRNNTIVGVEINPESGQQWINEVKSKTQPSIVPDFEVHSIENKTVAILSVGEYPIKPVALKGRCFRRIANSNHLMNVDEVANMRFRTFNTSWDSYFTNQHSLEDVSFEKVEHFINEMNRHRDIPVTDEPLTVLRKFELVKDGMPSNACFLLFAGIDIFQSTISAGRFADPITIKDSVTIRSDLFSQIRLIMEFIIKQINKAIILTGALQHEERWQYPLNAVREIVVNMVVHRNYQDSNDSIIKIYNDRIEFFNPGKLLEPLTIDRLLTGEYSSVIRNKNIAAIFKEAGMMEKYGSGISRILISFKKHGLKAPVFENFQHGFRVTIFAENETSNSKGDEYSTPNTDKQTGGQTSGQTGSQTGDQTIFTGHLTAPQKEVLELIFQNNRITRKELAGKLGKSESAIQKNINLLKSKKLIKRIGGDFGGYWEVNN